MSVSRTILGAGDVVASFVVEDVIGIGGMAIVYRAEQTSLRRKVALKVLSPELNADPEFRERFRREGQHAAALDHPNVVTIFDSGETADGRLYMAMRLVGGMTLAQRMSESGLSADQTIGILTPIAQAIDAAHALGLVHRDVKPQNILLSETEVPYLSDFGVARIASGATALTSTGSFVGSVHYAAPEQISGEPPGPAGDIYALSAVLYQCLSGQVPFPRDTEVAVMRAHLDEPPPRFPSLPTEVTQLDALIARGMAKLPTDRPRSARELLAEASDVLGVLPLWRRHSVPAFPASSSTDVAAAAQTVARDATWSDPNYAPPDVGAFSATVRRETPAPLTAGPAPAPDTAPMIGSLSPEEKEEEPPKSHRSRQSFVVVGGAAALLIAGGTAAAVLTSGRSPSTQKKASPALIARSGSLQISYRHPWLPAATSIAGSNLLSQPIVLASGKALLLAGTITDTAAVPGTLPGGFGDSSPDGTPRRLGAYTAAFYSWSGAGPRRDEAWIIPTTSSDLALVCEAVDGTRAALRACEDIARTALTTATPLQPGPDTSFAKSLDSVLETNAARRSHLASLGAKSIKRRALAALQLRRADRNSIEILRQIATPSRYAGVTTTLEHTLGREAATFGTVARQAGAEDRSGYTAAGVRATRASRVVEHESSALAPYDLHLPRLTAVRVPPLPVLRKHAPVSTPSTIVSSPSTATPSQPAYTAPAASAPPVSTHSATPPTQAPKPKKSSGGLVTAKPLS